jgi:hypothetical protein
VWQAAGGRRIAGIPTVTLAGIGGVIVLGGMMAIFLFNNAVSTTFAVTRRGSLFFMLGVILAGALWYLGAHFYNRRRGVQLGLVYREIPPE